MMKRCNIYPSLPEVTKRSREEDQRESFDQDNSEIKAILNAQHEAAVTEKKANISNSSSNVEVVGGRNISETFFGRHKEQQEEDPNIEGDKLSSSDDEDDSKRIWLPPPIPGSIRQRPRVGEDYQAILPSANGI